MIVAGYISRHFHCCTESSKLIFTIKFQKSFDNKYKNYYIIISNNNTRGKLMNEFIPEGFNTWYQYNKHNEKVAKIKDKVNVILGVVVGIGGIAIESILNATVGV